MNKSDKLNFDLLLKLEGEASHAKSAFVRECQRQFPIGSRVVFWKTTRQNSHGFGVVVGHNINGSVRIMMDSELPKNNWRIGRTKSISWKFMCLTTENQALISTDKGANNDSNQPV